VPAVPPLDALANLKEQNLSNNQLNTLAAVCFTGLTSLMWLDLSNNQLSTLSDGCLAELTSLVYLNLEENKLSTLLCHHWWHNLSPPFLQQAVGDF